MVPLRVLLLRGLVSRRSSSSSAATGSSSRPCRSALEMDVRVHDTKDAAIEAFCELIWQAAPRSLALIRWSTAGRRLPAARRSAHRERLDWGAVTALFGDERQVPPDSRDAQLHRLAADNVARRRQPGPRRADPGRRALFRGRGRPLRRVLARRARRLTLLGMGDDGHCASMFPGEPVLEERERLVVPSRGHYAPFGRYTLTYRRSPRSRSRCSSCSARRRPRRSPRSRAAKTARRGACGRPTARSSGSSTVPRRR